VVPYKLPWVQGRGLVGHEGQYPSGDIECRARAAGGRAGVLLSARPWPGR